jgi:hypothetical protein
MWDDELRLFGARNLKQPAPHTRICDRFTPGIFTNWDADPLTGAMRLFNFLKQSVALVGLPQKGEFKNSADRWSLAGLSTYRPNSARMGSKARS